VPSIVFWLAVVTMGWWQNAQSLGHFGFFDHRTVLFGRARVPLSPTDDADNDDRMSGPHPRSAGPRPEKRRAAVGVLFDARMGGAGIVGPASLRNSWYPPQLTLLRPHAIVGGPEPRPARGSAYLPASAPGQAALGYFLRVTFSSIPGISSTPGSCAEAASTE
jgi:hypothetical protein